MTDETCVCDHIAAERRTLDNEGREDVWVCVTCGRRLSPERAGLMDRAVQLEREAKQLKSFDAALAKYGPPDAPVIERETLSILPRFAHLNRSATWRISAEFSLTLSERLDGVLEVGVHSAD